MEDPQVLSTVPPRGEYIEHKSVLRTYVLHITQEIRPS